jgi:hypothetical protein
LLKYQKVPYRLAVILILRTAKRSAWRPGIPSSEPHQLHNAAHVEHFEPIETYTCLQMPRTAEIVHIYVGKAAADVTSHSFIPSRPYSQRMFSLVALPIAAYVTSVAGAVPYYDPRLTGGSMLTFQNEPLNVGDNITPLYAC